MFPRKPKTRSTHPSYYNGRIKAGYLDEYMELINFNSIEDFNKVMYYNYMELLRRKAERTSKSLDYIPFYSSNWVEDTWDNNPNF
jgi:hypothetical protein